LLFIFIMYMTLAFIYTLYYILVYLLNNNTVIDLLEFEMCDENLWNDWICDLQKHRKSGLLAFINLLYVN